MDKQRRYYDIKVDVLLPALLTYRVLAETPEEAYEKIKNSHPITVNYKLREKKDIKAIVYEMGSSIIKLIKNIAVK